MYRDSTLMTFYNYQTESVKMNFDMLAQSVASTENPYAIAHVIHFRKNYTAVPYLLEKMINDSRDTIIKTFDYQRQGYISVLPDVRQTSSDVNAILLSKQCNETIIENFFMYLLQMTSYRVTMSISEGYSAYITQMTSQYAPFMLFSSYTSQLMMCGYNPSMFPLSETATCMVQVRNLF